MSPPSDHDEAASAEADVTTSLAGRQAECAALDRLLDDLREGRSGALVVCGERGVGKTALLEYARDRAEGCRVLVATAAPMESDLTYAGLHQLCGPLLDHLERLPAPQRAALATAFGLDDGILADRFFLGLAVLSLLSEACREQPLLCVVDDAQWLDEESASIVAFAARRLPPRIGFAITAGEAGGAWDGLPQLDLKPLTANHSRALLQSLLAGPIDGRVRDRMIGEAGGNPAVLLEIGRAAHPAQLAGGFGDPDAPGSATAPPHADVVHRLAELSPPARQLVVLAAAEPLGEALLLWRAAERLGIAVGAADAAHACGLIEIGASVRFRDPLVRAAVYRSAPPAERRAAHAALAAATDPEADPARRAWHLSRAAFGPDADVAASLEQTAQQAAALGGLAAKGDFLLRAAALTPPSPARSRRALAAGEVERQAGAPERALRALVTAEAEPLDPRARAEVDLLRARMAEGTGADDAAARLLDAALRLQPLDVDLARTTYLDALAAAIRLGADDGVIEEIARQALANGSAMPPRPSDLLLDGLAVQIADGHEAAAPTLARAVVLAADDVTVDLGLAGAWLPAHVASVMWEHDLQRRLAERQLRGAREAGALAALPRAAEQLVHVRLREGAVDAATELLREFRSGPPVALAALVAAHRGDQEKANPLIARARSAARGVEVVVAEVAHLVLHNGLGRYDEALRSSGRVMDELEPVTSPPWALPELIEAAARCGALGEARAALDILSTRARASGVDGALGLEARSRALLHDGEEAERLYREALERLGGPGSAVDLARTHLAYGEWLRRAGRRVDARAQLQPAAEMLGDMGIAAFAERASRELRATGQTARKRSAATRDDLTPQEEQIALLARAGLSNPEIGARLYISPRTVEWHMRKIFLKLGISSRMALREALPDPAAATA